MQKSTIHKTQIFADIGKLRKLRLSRTKSRKITNDFYKRLIIDQKNRGNRKYNEFRFIDESSRGWFSKTKFRLLCCKVLIAAHFYENVIRE